VKACQPVSTTPSAACQQTRFGRRPVTSANPVCQELPQPPPRFCTHAQERLSRRVPFPQRFVTDSLRIHQQFIALCSHGATTVLEQGGEVAKAVMFSIAMGLTALHYGKAAFLVVCKGGARCRSRAPNERASLRRRGGGFPRDGAGLRIARSHVSRVRRSGRERG
jgi:hypothetical protein